MEPAELINLMRQKSLASVLQALIKLKKKSPDAYKAIVWFYESIK